MTLFADRANFGTPCKLVYSSLQVVASQPPQGKRLKMNPSGGIRGTESTEVVETTEEVTLRVYYDKKSFTQVGGFEFVDGSCMTICGFELFDNIKRANFMIAHIDRGSDKRYQKMGEPIIHGLDSNYVMAFWKKV